jgi:hypothetical protein
MNAPGHEVWWKWTVVLLLLTLLVSFGCGRQQRVVVDEISLGKLYANQVGSTLETEFRIPNTSTQSVMCFVVHGLRPVPADWANIQRLLERLANGGLRLRVQFFEKQKPTNDFYVAEFYLGSEGQGKNFIYSNFGDRQDLLFFLKGLRPLAYDNSDLCGEATVAYRFQRGVSVLQQGRLVPGIDYRAKLTIIDPTSLTNALEFRLYNVCVPRRNRNDN